jgi:hypothetical protein
MLFLLKATLVPDERSLIEKLLDWVALRKETWIVKVFGFRTEAQRRSM